MLDVREVTSFDVPELEPYRTMRRPLAHRERGIFVAEGVKVVRRLLESNYEIVSLLVTPEWFGKLQPRLEERGEAIQVFLTDKKGISALTRFGCYQAIKAVGRIARSYSVDDIVRQASRPRLLAAIDGINSCENLGALVRSAAGFGVQGLLMSDSSCSPFIRRAVHSSMGAVFGVPVAEKLKLPAVIRDLKRKGIRCIAAHPRSEQITLAKADLTSDVCVVFGSEGEGISESVVEACDQAVAVPMVGDVDSLNVASSAAVFLYEVCRQRGLM